MSKHPNVVFVLADQLRAKTLPLYGGTNIKTPNIDRLAGDGITLTNCISTCPVCTPYRSMLLTGRHPQTTGMVINSLKTRYSEISVADALNKAGYESAWVGKWHLHTGSWPANNVPDWVPHGRARLGFDHWRGYNQHMVYFDGYINSPDEDYNVIQWKGYETEGLFDFGKEFMDASDSDKPFALFLSPQQPHVGMGKPESRTVMAPDRFFEELPEEIDYPANVPDEHKGGDPTDPMSLEFAWRNYLAMTLAVDEMIGNLLDYLDENNLTDHTLFVFTSDHGTQGGAKEKLFWCKKRPYQESTKVPCVVRLPGVFDGGKTCDALTSPVDLFPTICSACNVSIPKSVEGMDLKDGWRGEASALVQQSVFCMNFGGGTDYFRDGDEWRGVRTETWQYTEWLDGSVELFNLAADPLEQNNLAGSVENAEIEAELRRQLRRHQEVRGDKMLCGSEYANWVDEHRRVIRNGFGELSHPESTPDWSLL